MTKIDGELEEMVKKSYNSMQKVVIIPDVHAPYEDYRALHGIYKFIKDYKPDKVIQMGDLVDFYALSSFNKKPDRILSLQNEIDVARYHLGEIRKVHKGAITVLEGNHEVRLMRYLMANPEMASLDKVNNVPALLGLDDFNVNYKKSENMNGVLFKHGHVVRKHSGYSAKAELENEGTSGVSGHTHRIASHYKTDRAGQHAWFEMGHLCEENAADYMEGKVANWQKGFGVMEYNKSKKFWRVQQIPIIHDSFVANGKFYQWDSKAKIPERRKLGVYN